MMSCCYYWIVLSLLLFLYSKSYNSYSYKCYFGKVKVIKHERTNVLLSKVSSLGIEKPLQFQDLINEIDNYSFEELYISGFLPSQIQEGLIKFLSRDFKYFEYRTIGGYTKALRRKLIIADTRKDGQTELLKSLDESDYLAGLFLKFNDVLDKEKVLSLLTSKWEVPETEIGDVIDKNGRREWLCIVSQSFIHDIVKSRVSSFNEVKILERRKLDVSEITSFLIAPRPAQKPETMAIPGINASLPILTLKEKEMVLIENSLRLDAVISGGLSISRSGLIKLIDQGRVFINDQVVDSPSLTIKAGQTVTVKAIGKVWIEEVAETSKGKYRINCRRIKNPLQG